MSRRDASATRQRTKRETIHALTTFDPCDDPAIALRVRWDFSGAVPGKTTYGRNRNLPRNGRQPVPGGSTRLSDDLRSVCHRIPCWRRCLDTSKGLHQLLWRRHFDALRERLEVSSRHVHVVREYSRARGGNRSNSGYQAFWEPLPVQR